MSSQQFAMVAVLGAMLAGTLPRSAVGQCTLHHFAEMPGVCNGFLVVSCGPDIDSILWSDGQSFEQQACSFYGPPGPYTYQAYDNGSVVYSGSATIESHGWDLSMMYAPPSGGGPSIIGYASLFACANTTNNHPCCTPGPVEAYLVQDDTIVTQDHCYWCSQLNCDGATIIFSDLDFGHTYSLQLVDSVCAGVVQATMPPITVPSCANLVLDIVVTPSIPGLSTGSIELVQAVPDTTEPYPIHAPVVGIITLYEGLTGSSTVGGVVASSVSRTWSALDTGYYRVEFAPDAGCQIAMDTIYVPATLNVGTKGPQIASSLSITPSITDASLTLRSNGAADRVRINIRDAYGRMVLEASIAPGPFSVERLVPGTYFLTAVQGREELRARFIKR